MGVATSTPVLPPRETNMKELIGDYETFIAEVSAGLERLGVNRSEVSMMDHICYRVETTERYNEMMERLEAVGTMIGENMVSGRPIATFELDDYLQVDGWTVPYVELPAPKTGSFYKEGLEHVELVVVGSLGRFLTHHTELPFSSGGMNKKVNPEAGLKAEGISVKFHEQQLGAVVRIEKTLAKESSGK
jgi:predicted metalloenzyme YecM